MIWMFFFSFCFLVRLVGSLFSFCLFLGSRGEWYGTDGWQRNWACLVGKFYPGVRVGFFFLEGLKDVRDYERSIPHS